MKDWIIKFAIGIIVGKVLPKLISEGISDKDIDKVADQYAAIVTDAGKKAAGKNWNKLEDAIQDRAIRFFNRFMTRLNYDD
ncbi:MAG: phasin family protein [Spirochaetes bacterium]|nr:phasin family protein [Spirochaetota bacterium]